MATAALALHHQVIPHTPGVPAARPEYGLDLVLDGPRPAALRTALIVARGYGGFNAALVLGAVAH